MELSANQIRLIHAVVFFILMGSLGFAIYSVIVDDITRWTFIALLLIFIEGVVLMACGWRCPLTTLAESRGAENGAVADLFLPRIVADYLFQIFGTVYAITLVFVLLRWLG